MHELTTMNQVSDTTAALAQRSLETISLSPTHLRNGTSHNGGLAANLGGYPLVLG